MMSTEPILNNASTYGLDQTPSIAPPDLSVHSAPAKTKIKPFLIIFVLILIISLTTLFILKFEPSPVIRSTHNPFDTLESQTATTNPFATLR